MYATPPEAFLPPSWSWVVVSWCWVWIGQQEGSSTDCYYVVSLWQNKNVTPCWFCYQHLEKVGHQCVWSPTTYLTVAEWGWNPASCSPFGQCLSTGSRGWSCTLLLCMCHLHHLWGGSGAYVAQSHWHCEKGQDSFSFSVWMKYESVGLPFSPWGCACGWHGLLQHPEHGAGEAGRKHENTRVCCFSTESQSPWPACSLPSLSLSEFLRMCLRAFSVLRRRNRKF